MQRENLPVLQRIHKPWKFRIVILTFAAVMISGAICKQASSARVASILNNQQYADSAVLSALAELERFYNVQSDPASAVKTNADFTKALGKVTGEFPASIQRDKYVALVVAVLKADRGLNVVREVRAITNREPTFWLAWRCQLTASLISEDQRKAMIVLQDYHKKVLAAFVDREAGADNQDLVNEIFWVRDACQQMGNLEDASERWVDSILRHEEAERMLAQLANVEAIKQRLAEEREKKDAESALLNKDPEQAKRSIRIIMDRLDTNMAALQSAFKTAEVSLPAIRSANQTARSNLYSAIAARDRAVAALGNPAKANAITLANTMAARGAVSQAEKQLRDTSRLYSKQVGIMQTAVVRMAAVVKSAGEQIASAKTQYAEALAMDVSANAAMSGAEQQIAAHARKVPQVPTSWVDKGAKSQEVAASLAISIEDIFEAAKGKVTID